VGDLALCPHQSEGSRPEAVTSMQGTDSCLTLRFLPLLAHLGLRRVQGELCQRWTGIVCVQIVSESEAQVILP
jgi:hypothetical protein